MIERPTNELDQLRLDLERLKGRALEEIRINAPSLGLENHDHELDLRMALGAVDEKVTQLRDGNTDLTPMNISNLLMSVGVGGETALQLVQKTLRQAEIVGNNVSPLKE